MRRLLVLLWLLPLSLSAAPYVISPTNDPGVIGQQLFTTGVQGYHYWDWGTNAASSNATVLVASPSIGVTTNSPGSYTPFWSATMTNWLGTLLSQGTNNSTLTSNGVFSVFNDGTNKSYGYTRTINAQGTNFTTATSNLLWLQITNGYVIAGANVTVTTNASGQTISYTIASTGGGSTTNVFIAAGANVTVTTNVVGSSTIYTIAASSGAGIAAAAGVDMLLTTNSGVVTFNFNTNATSIATLTGTNSAVIQFGGGGATNAFEIDNSGGNQVFGVTSNGIFTAGTNAQLKVDTSGNVAALGGFLGGSASTSSFGSSSTVNFANGSSVDSLGRASFLSVVSSADVIAGGRFTGHGGGLTNLPFTVSGAALETTNASGINNVLVSNAVPIGSASVQIATNPVAGGITYTFTATAGSVSSTNAVSYVTTNGTSVGTSGAITNIGFWTSTSGLKITPYGTNLGSGQINLTLFADSPTNNDTVVSNGMFNVFNDGTNVIAGYARTLSANNTNNATVVSNGIVAMKRLDFIDIPLSAFYTNNNVVLPLSPATPLAVTNLSSGWQFANGVTNAIQCAISLPDDWDLSALRVRTKMSCIGTNSIFTTNAVFRLLTGMAPPASSYTNQSITFNTIRFTNNCPSGTTMGAAVGTGSVTTDVTPAGTLNSTNTLLIQIYRDGGQVLREATNGVCLVDDLKIYYFRTNQFAMPTPSVPPQ